MNIGGLGTMMIPETREMLSRRNPRYAGDFFSVQNDYEDFGYDPRNTGPRNQALSSNTAATQSLTTNPVGEPQQTTANQSQGGGPSDIGTLDYDPASSGNYSSANLPAVTDPEKAFANVGLRQHEFLVREFRPFEQALIESRQDTSLIDAVPEQVEEQARIAREIDERNRSRYGYNRTAVEQQEVAREAQRTQNLGLAGGLNNARLAQRERNQNLLAQLVNIGQGLNRGSLGQMGSAAEMALGRKNAYTQAKAQAKAQRWGFLGSL